MKKIRELHLNKQTVSSLDSKQMCIVNGGLDAHGDCRATYRCDKVTGGCTDGCMTLLETTLNCTDGHCTSDCGNGMGSETEKAYTSGRG